MPVDNAMYDRLSHTWWEAGGFLNFLRAGVNPVRFGYMRRVLTDELGLDPGGLTSSTSAPEAGCSPRSSRGSAAM